MTLDEARSHKHVSKFGLTTDIDRWCSGSYAPQLLYLAGKIVLVPNPGGSLVCKINSLNSKHRKVIRINRRRGRDWKTAALLRLGFTDTEIGTAKLLTRMGVEPA